MAERLEATWRGLPAWRIATDELWTIVCPERGGKITSIFHVPEGREWLAPAPLTQVRPLTYGSLYSSYDMCGWDDAFPTFGECDYPGPGRLAGVRLPDHGEVWSREWEDESGPTGPVVMSIGGVALPYRLRKRVSVEGAALTLDYDLMNEGDEPMPFQWVGHPMLGRRFVGDTASGDGWVTAMEVGRPGWLRVAWNPAEVPARMDLQGSGYVDWVVFGPATSAEPSLEAAVAAGQAPVLPPGQTARWTVTATVGAGDPR